MSAISKTKICNRALTLLGADRITNVDTEDSIQARTCLALYDETLEDILMEHIWTFAQKRKALGLTTADPVYTDDGVTLVYQRPVDCLKVNFTNIESALVKIEGDKILSDTADLNIKYTFRLTDPQKYSPKFITAFATLLAAEMAFTITASRSMAELLAEAYTKIKLPDAVHVDSQQGTPISPMQDDILLARLGAGSALVGRTSWETWFPVCGC